MFKPFYVHFNRPVRKTDNSKKRHAPRGFTFFVEPANNTRNAVISGTFCAALDEFSKKEGRIPRQLGGHADIVTGKQQSPKTSKTTPKLYHRQTYQIHHTYLGFWGAKKRVWGF